MSRAERAWLSSRRMPLYAVNPFLLAAIISFACLIFHLGRFITALVLFQQLPGAGTAALMAWLPVFGLSKHGLKLGRPA